MKSNAPVPAANGTPPEAPRPPRGVAESWTHFWLAPTPTFGLHTLRVLAGLLFLFWLLSLGGQRHAFFGLDGWFDRQAYVEQSRLPPPADPEEAPPPTTWSFLYRCGDRSDLLDAAYWCSLGVLLLFTLGIATPLTGVLTWIIVASFLANPVTRHEADFLLAILAFYLMVGYLLLFQWSGTSLFAPFLFRAGDRERVVSHGANLAIRLLQVHFALIVVVSGFHKLQFGSWWAGVALWFPSHAPFDTTAESLKAESAHASTILFVLSLVQYLVLAWQIGFPLFAWRRAWRVVLLGGAILGWIGCVAVTKQPIYGPFFVIASLSYLTAAEWAWIANTVFRRTASLGGGVPVARADERVRIGANR